MTFPFRFSARIRSIRHATAGLAHMLRTQHNAWVHAGATLAVTAAGFAFDLPASDWIALVLAMAVVWAAEALNT